MGKAAVAAPHRLLALWAGAAAQHILHYSSWNHLCRQTIGENPPTPNALHVLQLAFAQKLAIFPESPVID